MIRHRHRTGNENLSQLHDTQRHLASPTPKRCTQINKELYRRHLPSTQKLLLYPAPKPQVGLSHVLALAVHPVQDLRYLPNTQELLFWLQRRSPTSPNVCLCVVNLKIYLSTSFYSIQNVPECSRMFQNRCRMLQNVQECMQKVPECYRMHAECFRINADP